MIRNRFGKPDEIEYNGFRLRSLEVSRLEGLSDAVFGFAITLLVVSLEVPATYAELVEMMRGFVAFGLCFAILVMIWHEHYVFFRRYGLEDGWIIVLNSVLLFVVTFYIYPLKFMFSVVLRQLFGLGGRVTSPEARVEAVHWTQAPTLMAIYGLSVLAVFLVLGLMYLHAYRRRDALGLDALEVHITRTSLQSHAIWIGVALLSIAIALLLTPWWRVPLAGFTYSLLGPLQWANAWIMEKRGRPLRDLRAAVAVEPVGVVAA